MSILERQKTIAMIYKDKKANYKLWVSENIAMIISRMGIKSNWQPQQLIFQQLMDSLKFGHTEMEMGR